MTSGPRPSVVIESVVDEGLGHSSYVIGLGDGTALVIDPARFPDRATPRSPPSRAGGSRGRRHPLPCRLRLRAAPSSPQTAPRSSRPRGVEPRGRRTARLDGGDASTLAPGVDASGDRRRRATRRTTSPTCCSRTASRVALFSGGSLMVGTVGRTDLLGAEHRRGRSLGRCSESLHAEILDPARRPRRLPDPRRRVVLLGARGPASARPRSAASAPPTRCSASTTRTASSSRLLGRPRHASRPTSARLPELNRRGPPHLPGRSRRSHRSTSTPSDAHVAAGAVVVDARPIADVRRRPRAGVDVDPALRPVFASWLGWLVDLGSARRVRPRRRPGPRPTWSASASTVGHEQLARRARRRHRRVDGGGLPDRVDPARRRRRTCAGTVLDVRQRNESTAGHVPGAIHVELGDLADAPSPPDR